MRVAAVVGVTLAIVLGMVGLFQISALQDLSKGTIPATVDELFGTTTFIWLLLVVGIAVMVPAGLIAYLLHRR